MALANSSAQSHLTPTSTASPISTASFFRTSEEIRKTSEEQVPRLLSKYRTKQSNSQITSLPQELELLVLSACSKHAGSDALFKLGLTCNYWHLRVRDHIENHDDGKRFRRSYEHYQFIRHNSQLTPVKAVKAVIKESFLPNRKIDISSDNEISKLKTSNKPEVVKVGLAGKWSTDLGEALAARKRCMTVLDMRPKVGSAEFIGKAVHATPRGSYIALQLPAAGIPAEYADGLAKAIKEHPVLCHVATLADDPDFTFNAKEPDLSLFTACGENGVEGIFFSFEYENLGIEEAQQIAAALLKFNTSVTLEIYASQTSKESVDVILDTVCSLNEATPGKVNLICNGPEIVQAVGKARSEELKPFGIQFENSVSAAEFLNSFFQLPAIVDDPYGAYEFNFDER